MKKAVEQNQRAIALLQEQFEERAKEIETFRSVALEIHNCKDNSLKGVYVTTAGGVAVAIIAASALIYTKEDPAPPPSPEIAVIDCPEVRSDSRDLYREDGFWTDLPASSPAQDQCDINEYIVNLPKP